MAGQIGGHAMPGLQEEVSVPNNFKSNSINNSLAARLETVRLLILNVEEYRGDREIYTRLKGSNKESQMSIVRANFTAAIEEIQANMAACRAIQIAENGGVMPTPPAITTWLALNRVM